MIALDRLQQIIPPDQALANKALATSLQQVTGISNLTLPQFARAVSAVETTRDLPLITALETPVPAAVANYYKNTLGQGTGNDNTVRIMDILGTVAGWNLTGPLIRTVQTFASINLLALIGVYVEMNNVVSGLYGDPVLGPVIIPSGPYAGTYTNANEAFSTVLIPAANTEIANLVAAYPTQVASMNADWNTMAGQSVREINLQALADIVYADFTANQTSSIYGLIYSLPSLALDTSQGGNTQLLESLADLTSFFGQSIVACLRQERNQQALTLVGIQTTAKIPSEPAVLPTPAELLPSEYSESDATDLVIK
jgi:hypothetical protein